MSDFNDIDFMSTTNRDKSLTKNNSNFKPRFYIAFLILFFMYYFLAPLVSHLFLSFVKNNIKLTQFTFLLELFERFFIPSVSILLILIVYIFLVEERNISFLFECENNKFLSYNVKGIIFAVLFLFSLIFIFIFKNYEVSFKLNRNFKILNVLQLIVLFIFIYIKYFCLESLYIGWLFNILSFRYDLIPSVLLSSIIPVIIGFIDYQRIGMYLIYLFLFNVLLCLLFVLYKNIFIVTSFVTFYDFLKKYILSLDNMNLKLEPVFYTIINNKELYNIENNKYSLIVLGLAIGIVFILYKSKSKTKF